jgi:hypothetical protein
MLTAKWVDGSTNERFESTVAQLGIETEQNLMKVSRCRGIFFPTRVGIYEFSLFG